MLIDQATAGSLENLNNSHVSKFLKSTTLQCCSDAIALSNSCEHLARKVGVSFKEVIQPQVPLGLPCYDFTPVMNHSVVNALPKVKLSTSGATHSHGVTGGVYKARERIHRDILIRDY